MAGRNLCQEKSNPLLRPSSLVKTAADLELERQSPTADDGFPFEVFVEHAAGSGPESSDDEFEGAQSRFPAVRELEAT